MNNPPAGDRASHQQGAEMSKGQAGPANEPAAQAQADPRVRLSREYVDSWRMNTSNALCLLPCSPEIRASALPDALAEIDAIHGQLLAALDLQADFSQTLADAADDNVRLHAEKMKFFERVIELEAELADLRHDIARATQRNTDLMAELVAWQRPCDDVEAQVTRKLLNIGVTETKYPVVPADFASRLAAQLRDWQQNCKAHIATIAAQRMERIELERQNRDLLAQFEQERDIRYDRETVLRMLTKALDVADEPHQTFDERLLEKAEQLAAKSGSAPANHPDCAVRCQLKEHKGYDTCTNTGQCDALGSEASPDQSAPQIEPSDHLSAPDSRERAMTAASGQIASVTFCPADGDPCRKECGTVCERTGGKPGKIPQAAPERASAPREPQVMGRVWNQKGNAVATLNSIGRKLPDNAPLYAAPASVTEAEIESIVKDSFWPNTNAYDICLNVTKEVLALTNVRVTK